MIVWFLFTAGLALSLLPNREFPLALAGWSILAVLTWRRLEWGIRAAIFFMSFFHPVELPKLLFTPKHYHLAIFLLVGVQILQRQMPLMLQQVLRRSIILIPLFVLLGLATVAAFSHQEPAATYLMTANLGFVILSVAYLSVLTALNHLPSAQMLFLFSLGAAVQAVVNFYNLHARTVIFGLDLLYNNQFGLLMAFTLFYATASLLIARSRWLRLGSTLIWLVLSAALILSCSRTAWLSFGITAVLILCLAWRGIRRKRLRWIVVTRLAILFLLGLAAGGLFFIGSQDVSERILHLLQLLDPVYWSYTLTDHQNYGFLGILRIEHLRQLKDIFVQHPIMGIGFAHRVTDFHGSSLVIFGASGLAGLICYGIFAVRILTLLLRQIRYAVGLRSRFTAWAAAGAFLTWQFSHLTQSMLVHYSAWFSVLLALVIITPQEVKVRKIPLPQR